MQKLQVGKVTLVKYTEEEYYKETGLHINHFTETNGREIKWIMWGEVYNENNELIARTEESLIKFVDGGTAYTNRNVAHEGDLDYCMQIMLDSLYEL